MIHGLEEMLRTYTEYNTAIAELLKNISPDGLNWKPYEGANSIYVLVSHVFGAQRLLIGEVVGGKPANRDRDAEFQASGSDVQPLLKLIDETNEIVSQTLGALHPEDLQKTRTLRGTERTVAWCLYHALTHTAHHRGQMELNKRIWENR